MAAPIGLETFVVAQVDWPQIFAAPLPSGRGSRDAGPALATRELNGAVWSGSVEQLKNLENPTAVAGLVVADTWLRNRDRYCPEVSPPRCNWRNVYLAQGSTRGRARLIAMDFTACIRQDLALSRRVASLNRVRERVLLGRFPEFEGFLNLPATAPYLERLRGLDREVVRAAIASTPPAWGITTELGDAVESFLVDRAAYVAAEFWSIVAEAA